MIIGVAGAAGSGKDAVASIIAPTHPVWMDNAWVNIDALLDEGAAAHRKRAALRGHAASMALADPLKTIARDVYDFSIHALWGPSSERNKPDPRYLRPGTTEHLTPRHALQQIGTEMGRSLYANTWIDLGIRRAQQLLAGKRIVKPENSFKGSWLVEKTDLVVFSDVRFVNEIDAIHAAGGVVWYVRRPGAGLVGAAGAHQSEQEMQSNEFLEKLDHVIENNTTLAALREHVAAELEQCGL